MESHKIYFICINIYYMSVCNIAWNYNIKYYSTKKVRVVLGNHTYTHTETWLESTLQESLKHLPRNPEEKMRHGYFVCLFFVCLLPWRYSHFLKLSFSHLCNERGTRQTAREKEREKTVKRVKSNKCSEKKKKKSNTEILFSYNKQ